jgi:FixJ family two-component response regulator
MANGSERIEANNGTGSVNANVTERPLIAIVDDDPVIQTWLRGVLAQNGYPSVCFGSAEAFVEAVSGGQPVCVLLDMRLPGMSGLDLLTRLADRPNGPAVVMITGCGDVASARAALRAGATDFLEKPFSTDDLLAAVTEAVSRHSVRRMREVTRADALARLDQLTPREREVFMGVTDGNHNREVAEKLGISLRTVEAHRARLMDKLAAPRVSDLFRLRIAAEGQEALPT